MKKIIDYIKNHPTFILLIICAILIFLLVGQCSSIRKLKNSNNSMINYYTDSLRTERTKNGKLEYDKSILIASVDDLKKINKDLYDELQEEKGKVKVIIKEVVKIVHDTIYLHDTIYSLGNDDYRIVWNYEEYFTKDKLNYQKLSGNSVIHCKVPPPISKGTTITKNEIGMSIVTGIKENKGKMEIFVRSDYPGFTVTKLEGADVTNMLKPKVKKFGIGPNVSIGISSDFKPKIYVGAGVQWNIIRF